MPSYMIRDLPDGLIARAKAKARDAGQRLDAVLTKFLQSYAEHGTPHVAQQRGGLARAANMTADERVAAARRALDARWEAHRKAKTPIDGARGE